MCSSRESRDSLSLQNPRKSNYGKPHGRSKSNVPLLGTAIPSECMKSFGICPAYVSIRIEFGDDVLPEKCVGVCRDYLICYIQLKLDEWFEHAMVRMTTLTSRGNNQSNWRIKSITGSRRSCICDATWLDVIGGTIVVLVELLLAFGFFPVA